VGLSPFFIWIWLTAWPQKETAVVSVLTCAVWRLYRVVYTYLPIYRRTCKYIRAY
jgi:hypothetical protein